MKRFIFVKQKKIYVAKQVIKWLYMYRPQTEVYEFFVKLTRA